MAISNTYQPNAPTGKTTTGSAVGNREDLSNELTILAPEETPLLSLCGKTKASSTFHEWVVDNLASPSTAGIAEGSDVTSFTDAFSGRARLGNYVQTFRRDYLVSNLQQAVTSVGPANVAQAEAKSMRELKRDVEARIASASDMTVENGAGTPYSFRGLGSWISSSAQTTNPVPAAFRTPAASVVGSTLTEAVFNTMLGSIFGVNGEMNSLTGPANVAQAEAKSMRELKRDVEARIASASDMTVENGAGTPYSFRGLGNWIQNGAQTTNPVPAAFRTPAASVVSTTLTEAGFNTMLGSIFGVNGEMNSLTLVANVALRRVISDFSRNDSGATNENIYQVIQDATSKTITLSVSLYDSDFGVVKIVNGNPACMPTGTTNVGYVLNPKYLAFASLIPMGSTRLENQGGGERGYVDMTGTLVCKHPGAHGKIAY